MLQRTAFVSVKSHLSLKVVGAALISVCLIASMQTIAFYLHEDGQLKDYFAMECQLLLGHLSSRSAEALQVGDLEAVKAAGLYAMSQLDVIHCRIEDASGNVWFEQADPDYAGIEQDSVHVFRQDIMASRWNDVFPEQILLEEYAAETRPVGRAQLVLSDARWRAKLTSLLRTSLWTSFVSGTVVFSALFVVLRVLVMQPVRRLTHASLGMVNGDLEQRVEVTSSDEIGRMSAAFNSMAEQNQQMLARLEGQKHDLGEMAAEAQDLNRTLESIRRIHRGVIAAEHPAPLLDLCVDALLSTGGYQCVGIRATVGGEMTTALGGLDPAAERLVLDSWTEEDVGWAAAGDIGSPIGQDEDMQDGLCAFAVPMVYSGAPFGSIHVCPSSGAGKNLDLGPLLEELSDDLAFALHDLERSEQREAEIRRVQSLLDRERLLLREIHHRTKNNMQVIISLMKMRIRRSPESHEFLDDTMRRLQTMARAHDVLHASTEETPADFASANLAQYTRALVTDLRSLCPPGIDLEVDAEPMIVPPDALVPIGLIINELVTNSIEHGFLEKTTGTVMVVVARRLDNMLIVQVEDDGAGMPVRTEGDPVGPSRFHPAVSGQGGMGTALVTALAQQVQGRIEVASCSSGTRVRLLSTLLDTHPAPDDSIE